MMALLAVLCFGVTLVLQPLLIFLLSRARIVDVPNHRSSHASPTPRGGGIGAFVAVGLVACLWHPTPAWIVLLASVALGLLGLLDDFRPLGASVRLGAQLALALVAALSLWVWASGVWALLPVGVIFVAGFVNAFNFMDGINGISGFNALLMGASFAWIGLIYEQDVVVGLGLITVGCALGFIPLNLAGRIFLGDVGSYLFGGLIALTFALGVLSGLPLLLMVSPMVIYIVDTSTTVVSRARRGERLLEAHRSHIYQRLTRGSVGHLGVALFVAGCGSLMVVSAWVTETYSLGLGVALGVGVVGLYLASPRVFTRDHPDSLDLTVSTRVSRQSAGGSSHG